MSKIPQIVKTQRVLDERGWFSETFCAAQWASHDGKVEFVQDNHSYSRYPGTIRGIHFQAPPHAQAKLVRCIRGSIFDVAVDLRMGSPTFGQYASSILSADNGLQQFIPVGYGHAFVTLEPDTEILYKVSDYYAPDHEGGIRWDCPRIGIEWPSFKSPPTISDKDRNLPSLTDFISPFQFEV